MAKLEKSIPSTVRDGSDFVVPTDDDTVHTLLIKILKELKKTNLHLSLMTDTCIDNTEVKV